MRSATAILFAVSRDREGMFGIQDAVDVGCWSRKSREAQRSLTAGCEVCSSPQEPTQDSTSSHLDHFSREGRWRRCQGEAGVCELRP